MELVCTSMYIWCKIYTCIYTLAWISWLFGPLPSNCDIKSICLTSYAKKIFKILRHKEESEEDVYTRWEKDFDLVPNSVHGLFYEYLELGKTSYKFH